MTPPSTSVERLHELLADQAGGEALGASELHELDELRARFPEVDPGSFEQAAAALHLALIEPHLRPLPDALRARLLAQVRVDSPAPSPRPSLLSAPWLGWVAAAAAVVFLWLQPDLPSTASSAATLADLERAGDLRVASWTVTEDPGGAGVTGEVLWSSELQAGYMKFDGLAANDPSEAQYQLWIFDADRPAEYPVDGGVFDANGGETVVPIDAKIAVADPTLFAITLERPGGVVVSTRERLLLTGTPQ